MNLATFRRRARNHTLEVEHLLGVAAERPEGLADELERLIAECQWTDGGEISPGVRRIPWRLWARTAIAYARGGCDGLVRLVAGDAGFHRFALSLLEKIRDPGALDAILRIDARLLSPGAFTSADIERADYLARTLWFLIGITPPVPISPAEAATIRAAFHRLLPFCKKDVQRANIICVLGIVGDHTTLSLLSTHPPLESPWETTIKTAMRTLRKNLGATGQIPAGAPRSKPSAPATNPRTSTKPTRASAPAKIMVHDKARWHGDAGNFRAIKPPLPPEAGATHIAHYLRWCVENNLISDELRQSYPRDIASILNGTLDARDFLLRELDGVLDSAALNAAGRAFARAYYHTDRTRFAKKHGTYLGDHDNLAARLGIPSYCLPNDEASYARVKIIIDNRHREYLAESS
ncbi:hypothetical protein M2447_000164 [Ereboglobus sp. PH5-10]|uniref:DUF7832 domain-containing protein n=1 Tax=Ereboglobus sp. PH5-10 TaxID=2940629 RepID=UPI0024060E5D|nr:hypothetical protein [Ereboglobus sp. PH5-10]MDF9826088.1 hypothetical protein [Ereboglobus sp. PH5-10]